MSDNAFTWNGYTYVEARDLSVRHIGRVMDFFPYLEDEMVYSATPIYPGIAARIGHDALSTEIEVDAQIYDLPHGTTIRLHAVETQES